MNIQYNGYEVYAGFYKEPLMPAENHGYLGVRIQSPDRTLIMCNECGKFYRRIHTKHLQKHGLSMEEYRVKNGYSKNTPMIADAESLHLSKMILGKSHAINNNKEALENGKIARENSVELGKWSNSNERQNSKGTCYEQVKDRLKNYIERFGQLPTYNSFGEDGKAIFSLLKHRYGDVNEGFKTYGLPTKKLIPGSCVEYTFTDGEIIKVGYRHNNWDILIDKIKNTSQLFYEKEAL